MTSDSAQPRTPPLAGPGGQVTARVAGVDGSTGNRHLARLLRPTSALRDLGDLCHALCAVHGQRPDMIEGALENAVEGAERDWLTEAAASFARERHHLARLVAAAGPLPSTARQADCDAVLIGLRQAFGMLARSGRSGCALGAVEALVMEWLVIRPVLDRAADRFDVPVPACELPHIFAEIPASPAFERAMAFGAQQLLVQHHGLWDLLESRAAARDAAL